MILLYINIIPSTFMLCTARHQRPFYDFCFGVLFLLTLDQKILDPKLRFLNFGLEVSTHAEIMSNVCICI